MGYEPEDWKRLWRAIEDRRTHLGVTYDAMYRDIKVSGKTYRKMAEGEGLSTQLHPKAKTIDEGLGWEHGSVLAILAGGEPTVAAIGASATGAPDSTERRLADLESELGGLRRAVQEVAAAMRALQSRAE